MAVSVSNSIRSTGHNVDRDRWLGELSYPLYLCHLVVLSLVITLIRERSVPIGVIASLAMATVLVVLIEKPLGLWRQRRVESRQAAVENPPVF